MTDAAPIVIWNTTTDTAPNALSGLMHELADVVERRINDGQRVTSVVFETLPDGPGWVGSVYVAG